jgi:hypothetical protein
MATEPRMKDCSGDANLIWAVGMSVSSYVPKIHPKNNS